MLDDNAVTRIITHMNEDHADAVLLYVKAFAQRSRASSARMTGIDENGMDIQYTQEGAEKTCRVDFEQPLGDAGEARRVLVAMADQARDMLSN